MVLWEYDDMSGVPKVNLPSSCIVYEQHTIKINPKYRPPISHRKQRVQSKLARRFTLWKS